MSKGTKTPKKGKTSNRVVLSVVTKQRRGHPHKQICTKRTCLYCKSQECEYGKDVNLLQCTRCNLCLHALCHKPSLEHIAIQFRQDWECDGCKSCTHCGEDDREDELIFCDSCDRGYHTTCISLASVPEGDWKCHECINIRPYIPPARVRVHGNTFYIQNDRPPIKKTTPLVAEPQQEESILVQKLSQKFNNIQFDKNIVENEGIPSNHELIKESLVELNNKIVQVRCSFPYMTNMECIHALYMSNQDQNIVIDTLSNPSKHSSFLRQVRKSVATTHVGHVAKQSTGNEEETSDSDVSDIKSVTDEEFVPVEFTSIVKSPKKIAKKKKRLGARLTLNDAMCDVDNMTGWSEARKSAFNKIKDNPNTYYYRFNEPGQEQRNGPWTDAEKNLFLDRLKEVRHNASSPQWGIFSKAIPGRVGYQCSNFYRLLISKGEIKDENGFLIKSLKRKGSKNTTKKKKLKRSNSSLEQETDESEEKV
ncbi:hypothetical protein AKO1_012106 [Acrasis kona]|uniref:PHD finger protein 10 n=1 Tax=Acrasis kona TaxID=1008807 RepID=A0AAW2ZBU6_9EUKA